MGLLGTNQFYFVERDAWIFDPSFCQSNCWDVFCIEFISEHCVYSLYFYINKYIYLGIYNIHTRIYIYLQILCHQRPNRNLCNGQLYGPPTVNWGPIWNPSNLKDNMVPRGLKGKWSLFGPHKGGKCSPIMESGASLSDG